MQQPISPLRARRKALKLRAEAVAAAAEISLNTLWLLESGKQQATGLDTARRLAEALSTTVDAIFPPDQATVEPVDKPAVEVEPVIKDPICFDPPGSAA